MDCLKWLNLRSLLSIVKHSEPLSSLLSSMLTLIGPNLSNLSLSCCFKIAPVAIEKVIAESDLIVFASPTSDPYRAKVLSVLAAKVKFTSHIIELARNPKFSGRSVEVLPGSLGEPAILFLKRPLLGSHKWAFWNYSPAGLLTFMKGKATCVSQDEFSYSPKQERMTGYIVDHYFIFLKGLRIRRAGRVTEFEVSKEIKRLANK